MPLSDAMRRARLVRRHHLLRDAASPDAAVEALVAQHSSDPCTPYLALWARVPGFLRQDLDRALLRERSLWRLHAMRRTLFVVSARRAALIMSAASVEVAAKERKRLHKWLAAEMPAAQVEPWCQARRQEVLEALGQGESSTGELSQAIPALRQEITLGSGKWTQRAPVSSRVLFLLAMEGELVRTGTLGSWRASQYKWASAQGWFGPQEALPPQAQARAELLRHYLASHGPATLEDLRWWTGWGLRQTRAALELLPTAAVSLEGGQEGLVLAHDLAPEPETEPVAALLPALDSTPMGWKGRAWYLGDHQRALFDRNGNIGPSIWWGGRIVGGWGLDQEGRARHRLLEDVGAQAQRAIKAQLEALEAWLEGEVVVPRFRTPLEKELSSR